MNQKENGELKQIAKHVNILNEETGKIKIDVAKLESSVKIFKWILGYMATLLTVLVGRALFFG
ncbi:hypothetical protein LCGC14_2945640 [marine sediment metagenome]|uniref:Uncharacterized protein n=1 Tax=marine sediment metagenome TaxID=412755 RepID=A0A0F9A7X0_9ZZZZ